MVVKDGWVPVQLSSSGPRALPSLQGLKAEKVQTRPVSAPARKLNIQEIPFAFSLELFGTGNYGQISRTMASKGWSVRTAEDCSHNSDGTYTFITSPDMTLSGGGREKIFDALGALKPLGLTPGDTGAMRIWIKKDKLDLDACRNLLKIFLSHESLIYRLAQNGQDSHHGTRYHGNKKFTHSYCMPLSRYYKNNLLDSSSVDTLFSGMASSFGNLSANHEGLNFRNTTKSGFLEFRYFNSTLDPEAVSASVDLLLGMVKAAYEGRLSDLEGTSSLDEEKDKPFSWSRFHRFLDETVGDSPSRDVLERIYETSGGKLTEPPISASHMKRIARLEKAGFGIRLASGEKVGDWARALQKKLTVLVREPGQSADYAMSVPDFFLFARVEAEHGSASSVLSAMTEEMRGAGVRFYFPGGKNPVASRLGPERLLETGALDLDLNEKRHTVRTQGEFSTIYMQAVGQAYPPELREAALASADLLHRGTLFSASTQKGAEPLATGAEILWALGKGMLEVTLPGSKVAWGLGDPETGRQFLMAEAGRLDALPPATARLVELAEAVKAKGFHFWRTDSQGDPGAKLLVPLATAEGKLCYSAPGDGNWRPFFGSFEPWALAVLGRDKELDEGTRTLLATVEDLAHDGVTFTVGKEQAARHALMQALAGSSPITVRLPGEPIREFRNARTFAAFIQKQAALPETLSAEEQEALRWLREQKELLSLEIYSVGKHPEKLGTSRQAAWLLSDREPIRVVSRQPGNGRVQYDIPDLERLVGAWKMESGEGSESFLLDLLSDLKAHRVKFYVNVTAERPRPWKRRALVPIDLKWMQVGAFKNRTLHLSLPKRIWWNFGLRHELEVESREDLKKISQRLASATEGGP